MPTTRKSKNKQLSPKKGFIADNRETRATGIVETPTESVAACATEAEVTAEERHQLIAEAAYFRAECRNFSPGYELEDWLSAEAEVEMKLSRIHIDSQPGKA
jgi:hypothetical protein